MSRAQSGIGTETKATTATPIAISAIIAHRRAAWALFRTKAPTARIAAAPPEDPASRDHEVHV
jgi:hypothetical protein